MKATVNGLTSRTRNDSFPRSVKCCGQFPGKSTTRAPLTIDVNRPPDLIRREKSDRPFDWRLRIAGLEAGRPHDHAQREKARRGQQPHDRLSRSGSGCVWVSVAWAQETQMRRRSFVILAIVLAGGGRASAQAGSIRRMLADDRAQAFVSRFFFPWLELDKLGKADPDKKYFPDYDVSLRDSLAKETELFLLSQLRDDRDPIELWSADYTFLNEQLARHYGIPGVTGPQFRRVSLPTPERAGLLGQGSILMVTSRHQHGVDAAYTSPATRAKWVRMHFLGVPPPSPFPGAQPVKPELPITPQTRALPANPCVTCHRNFFPLGYALENFDPLGRWRTHDQAGPVDASGAFVDGTPTNGVVELRQVLLQRPDAFRTTITERLLAYSSTGSVDAARGTPDTLIRARQILRSTPKPRWSALIAAIVQ